MASIDAADLARALAASAEAVCRHYLPAGRRQGRYWTVGDVHNAPGRSLFIRLSGPLSGKGAAGRWQDAATGQHGDLLDLIRFHHGFAHFAEAAAEGRRFLGLTSPTGPRSFSIIVARQRPSEAAATVQAAQRLFASAHALRDTRAARYLAHRGLTIPKDSRWLRFHPRCFTCPEDGASAEPWPAMLAAVTDRAGSVVGVQRTFLAHDGRAKAALPTPRRSLGQVRGHAVRFGDPKDIMLIGEGVETVLSVVNALPPLSAMAALSATNLAAIAFPSALRRLYLAQDNDPAGRGAVTTLTTRAQAAGIEPIVLLPRLGDFNDDLRSLGPEVLRNALRLQLSPEDVSRVMAVGG